MPRTHRIATQAALCGGAGAALLAAVLLLVPRERIAASTRPAEVTALEGKAEREPKAGAREPLKVGAGLSEGDRVYTLEESRLELRLADRSLLRLGPNAKLQLTAAHFNRGAEKRKLSARLFFGNLWAKVSHAISGEQKFEIETENAVAGVRGTTFRVDAHADKSVLVKVYAGAVAVAKNVPIYANQKKGEERKEVEGPEEVSREKWERVVGKQMQILVAADGTPGEPEEFQASAEKNDPWVAWNEKRDQAADGGKPAPEPQPAPSPEQPAPSPKPE